MTSGPASELGRVGQVVAGKFRLDAVIGRGGMGSVWGATHVGLGHRLALKLIARAYVRSPEALRRFEAEARAAARLQSRHVVQVFDNGTLDDGTPYIAMELLLGENLSQRIERSGPLPLARAVDVLAQCCKALGRAHAAGIVHRDIKPDNIFLAREPDEDADVVKILDFGVAKMAIDVETNSQLTGTGALLGTPLYMSPEQVRGARDVDLRSDLYSLGLVAYTMLTGKTAIDGESFGDILLKICAEPLPGLLAAAPSLPPAMEAWFQRACAREPAGRYASAQELVDALRQAASPPAPGLPAGSSSHSAASVFGHTAAVASTIAAAGPPAPPAAPMAPVAPMAPIAPMATPVPSLPLRAPPAASPPVFSQSAAAVSLTAPGLPPKRSVAALLGAVLAGIIFVGGVGIFAFSEYRAHAGSTGAAQSAPPAVPSMAPAVSALPSVVLSPIPSARGAADASSVVATAVPAATVPPRAPVATAATPATSASPSASVLATRPPASSAIPVVPARPAHTIDVGY